MPDTEKEEKRIFLSSPTMNGREMSYIQEAFDTNWIAPLGANVDAFEQEFAKAIEANHAAALVSGTSALHLALKLLGVQQGDIVFSSDLTFAATCNPIMYEKATPVFIDCEEETWNMCPKALKAALEKYPGVKAVILTHLYGTPAKLDEILSLCEEYHVPLIEDAAEALGATYKGRYAGTFGELAAFSFNGNKIITTSGGGMLVGDDEKKIKKARFYATQAREPAKHYEHKEVGYNYRMSNIVAGIGRGQLYSLQEFVEKKRLIYREYKEAFADIEAIAMNPYLEGTEPNFWLSSMVMGDKAGVTPEEIMNALGEENIEARPVWKPMHLQPVYRDYDFIIDNDRDKDVGEGIFHSGICLPSDVKNTKRDMERIIEIIRGLFDR